MAAVKSGELSSSKYSQPEPLPEPLCGETGVPILPQIPRRENSDWADYGDRGSNKSGVVQQGMAVRNAGVPPLKLPSPAQILLGQAQTERLDRTRRQLNSQGPQSARMYCTSPSGFGPSRNHLPIRPQTQSPLGRAPSTLGRAPSTEPRLPLKGMDPVLQSIAKRMSAALVEYYRDRGVHVGMNDNWGQFFSDADRDGTDRLSLQEFDEAVRKRLRAPVSRYELRALWRRVDANGSGLATRQEFVLLMYKISLSDWPDQSQEDIRRCTEILNSAVNRWHKAGGNWFKIFKHIDAENSGSIGFDEFVKYVRGSLPGLRIPMSMLSDQDLRGYWKAIDDDGCMDVGLNKFMVFMRKHGAALSMHKSPRKSQVEKANITSELSSVARLGDDELAVIASRLGEALHGYLARQGMDGGSSKLGGTSPRLWTQLFDTITTKQGSARITFAQFENAIKGKLRAGKTVTDAKLRAFWCAVDADISGEITRDEFINLVYRLQLRSWPELSTSALEKVVRTLNRAADHYYRCSGNWYKVFAKFDEDRSGTMEFDELVAFIRRPLPGLRIPLTLLPDDEVRGLWRALDADTSGTVTTREFTAFMRQHGKKFTMHKQARPSEQIQSDEEVMDMPVRPRDQLQEIARTLEKALVAYWKAQGIHQRIGVTGGDWVGLFNECRFARKGRFTFSELSAALETRFQALVADGAVFMKRALHEDIRALWACVKPDGSGYVTEKAWCLTMYRLSVETWPLIDEGGLVKIVNEMDRAADQWHRAGGNWYKVFRIVDADGSAQLAFDELMKICRGPLPCLAITADRITDEDLKGLWRALDADASGEVTVQEFMIFMRRHATKQIHQSPKLQNQLKMAQRRAQTQTLVTLSPEQLKLVGKAVNGLSKEKLQSAFNGWGVQWAGSITEWELLRVVRNVLGLSEKVLDDDSVDALWSSLDRENIGSITAETLLALGPDLLQGLEDVEQ